MVLGIDVVIFDLLCLFFNDGDHGRSEPSSETTLALLNNTKSVFELICWLQLPDISR
jgi:hypothetical protein